MNQIKVHSWLRQIKYLTEGKNRVITKRPKKNQNCKKEAKNNLTGKRKRQSKTKLQFQNYAKRLVY